MQAMVAALLGGLLLASSTLGASTKIDLKVLYLGTPDTPRYASYQEFLGEKFARVVALNRDQFDSARAVEFDVVLLDWSQSDPRPTDGDQIKSPLGPRESWTKPVVLLGSAGLLMTAPWKTNGSYGCTCLHPFAYNLRDHEVFRKPVPIDRFATIKRGVPNDVWQKTLQVEQVDVVPLIKKIPQEYQRGWCSYENNLIEQPEVEFICGGINDKRPEAAAVWRQGNQLHFGFDLAPNGMSEAGQALLINSIVYITQFTQDRPIVQASSPFYHVATRARSSFEAFLKNEHYPTQWVDKALGPMVVDQAPIDRQQYLVWFRTHSRYMRPGDDGRLVWDDEAKSLQINYATLELFEKGIAALRDPSTRAPAAVLLKRYCPDGPAGDDANAWSAWYSENKPSLFYCEWGNYRWYIDPLAKARGIPTSELRGPARADVPNQS